MLSYTPPASEGGYIEAGPLGQAGFGLLPNPGWQHIVRPALAPVGAMLGRSSIGRATVFGTAGWRFESSRPSQPRLAGFLVRHEASNQPSVSGYFWLATCRPQLRCRHQVSRCSDMSLRGEASNSWQRNHAAG